VIAQPPHTKCHWRLSYTEAAKQWQVIMYVLLLRKRSGAPLEMRNFNRSPCPSHFQGGKVTPLKLVVTFRGSSRLRPTASMPADQSHDLSVPSQKRVSYGTECHFSSHLCDFTCLLQEQFIDMCILCGCDYCATIRGIGPKSALKLIMEHKTLEKAIASLDKTKYSIPEPFPIEVCTL
jgi:hypothetical protein